MKTAVLLISLAFIFEYNTEAYTPVDLFATLKSQIKNMTTLITIIDRTYSDDPYNHPLPKQYLATLDRIQLVLDDARNIFDKPKFLHKDTLHRPRMERERRNPRKPRRSYRGWYPKPNRFDSVIEGSEEDIIEPKPWARERWNSRRSFGNGRLPIRNQPRDPADQFNDDPKWDVDFYNALSKVLKKELGEEPLISERVREGYEPAPIYDRRRV